MVVVIGIKTAIEIAKIALRAAPIIYKGGKKIKPVAQYFDRHRKAAIIATTAATLAPNIYDLMDIDYSAIQKNIADKVKQTRGKFHPDRSRQFFKSNYRSRYRYRPCKQRQQYRSRYR